MNLTHTLLLLTLCFLIVQGEWNSLKQNGEIPRPRVQGVFVSIEEFSSIAIFGGSNLEWTQAYNDLWIYNINSNTWTLSNSSNGVNPPPVVGPSGVYRSTTKSIVIHGGYLIREALLPQYDIWEYSLEKNTWEQLSVVGPNASRSEGSAAYLESRDVMIIYGGHPIQTPAMMEFNFATRKWRQISIRGMTAPRLGCIIYPYLEQNIFLFGGFYVHPPFDLIPSNGLWSLKIEDESWQYLNNKTSQTIVPYPAYDYVGAFQKNSLLIHGGCQRFETPICVNTSGTLYSFDIMTSTWTKLAEGPKRTLHAGFTHKDKLYIYGGQDENGKPVNDMWVYEEDSTNPENSQRGSENDNKNKIIVPLVVIFVLMFGFVIVGLIVWRRNVRRKQMKDKTPLLNSVELQ